MKELWAKLTSVKKNTLIKNSFLLPILAVVVISLSHVVAWYGLGNPMSWAIYLSVAIEIFALASVSASSIKMKKGSIWLLFGIVTTIQIVGNVFFTYEHIDLTDTKFLSWVELIAPWFEDWNLIDHRRFLAYIQGGTLPFMSLIALHFYIKFNDNLIKESEERTEEYTEADIEKIAEILEADIEPNEALTKAAENFKESLQKEERTFDNTTIDDQEELEKEIMIPDAAVKAALKEKQNKETHVSDNITNVNEDKDKEVIPVGDSEDKIVTKVVQKPTTVGPNLSGQVRGHRKNPPINPQILPGTN